ncbi:Trimeric GatFAB AmidoTransferase(AdT) complex subunit [Lambiella insularis]|nr:Trimeric GatFAB AmidoTransferase(AdT) complex subunit [Lambiella insularis]
MYPILRNEKSIALQGTSRALNAFVSIGLSRKQAGQLEQNHQNAPLHGRLIAVKDNVCTLNYPTACGSKILKGFQSPYNAHVIQKLEHAGAFIAGKTNLDEFGMGSHSTHSSFGTVLNLKKEQGEPLSPGGSSGGSAVAVATGQCWAALGTDTGGSVRLPAAYTGTVGFKPSYGLISRYGIVAYANSLDTVGILADRCSKVKSVFDHARGYHALDPTSAPPSTLERIKEAIDARCVHTRGTPVIGRPLRIGVPHEYNIAELQTVVRSTWLKALQFFKAKGHSVHQVSLRATKLALSAYYVIAPAEASSNLAKYDGVRFGNHANCQDIAGNVLYATTRGEGFGEEVKKRILLGAYSLSASAIDNYFIQAQKVRRLVQQDFDNVFTMQHPLNDHIIECSAEAGIDVLLTPTAPSTPPTISSLANRSSVDAYKDDVMTVPASLAGLPAISVPVRINGKEDDAEAVDSVGLQIIAQYGDDDTVINAARLLEEMDS